MTMIAPARSRASVQDTAAGLEIIVPARRNLFVTLFLGLWLCGWLIGEVVVPVAFFRGGSHAGPAVFTAVWFVFWTIGGGFTIYVFSWSLAGKERILVSRSRLSIKRELFGLGRLREYDRRHISDLRVSLNSYNPIDFRAGLQFWGVGGGVLAFDYGATTVRFGAALEEGEAKSVIAQIKARALHA
jgi:hypothetical protein